MNIKKILLVLLLVSGGLLLAQYDIVDHRLAGLSTSFNNQPNYYSSQSLKANVEQRVNHAILDKLDSLIVDKWTGKWMIDKKFYFEYNEDGQLALLHLLEWDNDDQVYRDNELITYTYNEQKLLEDIFATRFIKH